MLVWCSKLVQWANTLSISIYDCCCPECRADESTALSHIVNSQLVVHQQSNFHVTWKSNVHAATADGAMALHQGRLQQQNVAAHKQLICALMWSSACEVLMEWRQLQWLDRSSVVAVVSLQTVALVLQS